MTLPDDPTTPTTPNPPPTYDAAPTYSQAGYQDQVYQDPTSAAPGYAPPADPPAPYQGGYPGQVPPGYPQPGDYTQPAGYPQPGDYTQPAGYAQPGGYPQPAPYGYTATGYPAYNPAAQTNTMAIVALVMAFVFAPLAIVFGHMARKQIRQTGEGGEGLALAALWCGYIFTALGVLVCGGIVLIFAAAGSNS